MLWGILFQCRHPFWCKGGEAFKQLRFQRVIRKFALNCIQRLEQERVGTGLYRYCREMRGQMQIKKTRYAKKNVPRKKKRRSTGTSLHF